MSRGDAKEAADGRLVHKRGGTYPGEGRRRVLYLCLEYSRRTGVKVPRGRLRILCAEVPSRWDAVTCSFERVTDQGNALGPSREVGRTPRCDQDVLYTANGVLLTPLGQQYVPNRTELSIVLCEKRHDCTLPKEHEAIPGGRDPEISRHGPPSPFSQNHARESVLPRHLRSIFGADAQYLTPYESCGCGGLTSLERYVYGAPEYVLTDNSRYFAAKFFYAVSALVGIRHYWNTSYHLPTNRRTELFNKTIVKRLRYYVEEHQRDWDEFLQLLAYSYKIQVHRSTEKTLFDLVVTRKLFGLVVASIAPQTAEVASDPRTPVQYKQTTHGKLE